MWLILTVAKMCGIVKQIILSQSVSLNVFKRRVLQPGIDHHVSVLIKQSNYIFGLSRRAIT